MTLPIDIHTHHLPALPGTAIENCEVRFFAPRQGACYSVGIHPCTLASLAPTDAACVALRQCASHPQVVAIGEAGLDRLASAPMQVQLAAFECQARLADEVGKPLIIHLVRATAELLQLKQALRPAVSWIIHGFRGKPELAGQYLRHGCYLSFGEHYHEEALRTVPSDRLLLETDESSLAIELLYRRAAVVRGVTVDELYESVQENIKQLFFQAP